MRTTGAIDSTMKTSTRHFPYAHTPRRAAALGVLWLAAVVGLGVTSSRLMADDPPSPTLVEPAKPAASGGAPERVVRQRQEEMGVDVEERVGLRLPLETQLTDSTGKLVSLAKFFPAADASNAAAQTDHRPAVILLVYYSCPIVCDVMMDKTFETLNGVESYTMGKDYRVLVISFDPSETAETAAKQKLAHLAISTRELSEADQKNVEFFVADVQSVRAIADALGFRYKRLENGQYSHPVVTFLATPDAKISRYLYGYPHPGMIRDFRLGIMEASEGKLVRTLGERIMNFCYMYDPKRGTYTLEAFRVMQIGGVLTMVFLTVLIGGLLLRERARKAKRAAAPVLHGQATSQTPPPRSPPPPSALPAT
jgi:protein SCO1